MIRIANEDDVENIYELNEELFKVLNSLNSTIYNPEAMPKDMIRSMINSQKADYILCEEDERIIGYVLVEKAATPSDRISSFKEYNYAMIEEIVVLPEYRMKGYGKILIDEATSWAKEKKLDAIELCVLSNNYNAIAFYENAGFEELQKRMRKEV